MARVLIIDDDTSLQRALRLGLTASGHSVISAANGGQGISKMASASPDVVVLDLGLPDVDGLTVLNLIRQVSDVPMIVLSATGSEERKVAALDQGADDYVTKPFGMAELEARIRAAMRHRLSETREQGPESLTIGPLHIDMVHHQAELSGVKVELTAREFDVLSFLAHHPGRICTRQMILQAVWGEGYDAEARYLHAYIHRLRQKLSDTNGTLIQTAPGIGYSLANTDDHVS